MVSSGATKMGTRAEDPEIPLVRINGAPSLFGGAEGKELPRWPRDHRYKYEHVGERLAKRKQLFYRRRSVADACLAVAALGVAVMLIHTELVLRKVYGLHSVGATLTKLVITLSTVGLVGLVTYFNYLHYKLHMLDNTMDDWRLVVSAHKVAMFCLEIVVCLIHPVPAAWEFVIVTPASDALSSSPPSSSDASEADAPPKLSSDVVLSLPMFLRLYLFCRVLLLRSKLFADARSQSLGALNKAKFNFYFVFKSLMYIHPVYCLAFIVGGIFCINAWAMRLCEVDHKTLRADYLNALWLIAITFTSVGYGDVFPETYCGRFISVTTGMLGAGCTALTVAVLAQKLELSRAEKCVNNFVIEMELVKQHKAAAANIIRHGWRVYKAKRGGLDLEMRLSQRRLLRAIAELHAVRSEQRKMIDNQVTVLELHRNQRSIMASVDCLGDKQLDIETQIDEIKAQVCSIGGKLDELVRIMAARKERRERKMVASASVDSPEDLLK